MAKVFGRITAVSLTGRARVSLDREFAADAEDPDAVPVSCFIAGIVPNYAVGSQVEVEFPDTATVKLKTVGEGRKSVDYRNLSCDVTLVNVVAQASDYTSMFKKPPA